MSLLTEIRTFQVQGGASITAVAYEAVMLAKIDGHIIKFTHNGRDMLVRAQDTVDDVVARWEAQP